ncbi:hypothetical protein BS50DRAFT_589142 [Corynespora cassiicola Philippines]|uniref:Secreted protein n=1 Tax=Corynespora cassiicola Philippines TaxID=1448308 RepID=A0A2T2NLV5_CORCC|nr:hypothetical protein BS50DRAFT_589142 [Corynespora cassiicola Philippines]
MTSYPPTTMLLLLLLLLHVDSPSEMLRYTALRYATLRVFRNPCHTCRPAADGNQSTNDWASHAAHSFPIPNPQPHLPKTHTHVQSTTLHFHNFIFIHSFTLAPALLPYPLTSYIPTPFRVQSTNHHHIKAEKGNLKHL